MTPKQLEKFMRRAFNLGQTYWQQADSESWSENKKSDVTLDIFNVMVIEAKAALQGNKHE